MEKSRPPRVLRRVRENRSRQGKGDAPSSPSYYRFVVNSLPVAVATVDSSLRITGFNAWAERITGYSENEVMGRSCGEILQGGRCKTDCPLRAVLDHRNPVLRLDTTIRNWRGETIPVRMNTAGLFDGDGVLVGGLEAFQDISDLKRAEREKENLISMFAHDMKSSVVVMGGFARRLLSRMEDSDTQSRRKSLEIIQRESEKLESLLNEFLEFSRLQAGQLTLNRSATYLPKELHDIVEEFGPKADKASIELVFEDGSDLSVIQADASRLRRVFSNLVDNALKYSAPATTVVVSVEERGAEVVVRVSDQGRGVDPGELPYIFDPFHRAPGVEAQEGFGLGLATVKAIVEAHGGRVWVESEPGKGSVFTVVLPRAAAGPPERETKLWGSMSEE